MDKPKHRLTKEEMETVIDQVTDLIDDSRYRPFFFSKLSILGQDEFLSLAKEARKQEVGFQGRKFTTLLKYGKTKR